MSLSIVRRTLLAALATLALSPVAIAETVAVIGTGNVGSALGTRLGALGHTIVYGSRDPSKPQVADVVSRSGEGASATTSAEAVVGADIVILAVPGMLLLVKFAPWNGGGRIRMAPADGAGV